jgi:hypothetical protein
MISVDLFRWNPAELTQTQHYKVTTLGLHAFAAQASSLNIIRADKNEFYRTYAGRRLHLFFSTPPIPTMRRAKISNGAKASGASIIRGHVYVTDWPGVIKAVDEAGA